MNGLKHYLHGFKNVRWSLVLKILLVMIKQDYTLTWLRDFYHFGLENIQITENKHGRLLMYKNFF